MSMPIAARWLTQDVAESMRDIGRAARAAARDAGARLDRRQERRARAPWPRDAAHVDGADPRRQRRRRRGRARCGPAAAFLDRLTLDAERASKPWREASTRSPRCPIRSARSWPHGRGRTACDIARVRVPLGVIGIIYESRPNVTADAGGAVPQVRQRRDPARRLGQPSLSRAIHACLRRGPAPGRPARSGDPARADRRSRGGGHDARRA